MLFCITYFLSSRVQNGSGKYSFCKAYRKIRHHIEHNILSWESSLEEITLLNGSTQLVNEFYTFYFGFAGFFILFLSITYVALTILKWLPFLHLSKKTV